jgi:hypothetical protein
MTTSLQPRDVVVLTHRSGKGLLRRKLGSILRAGEVPAIAEVGQGHRRGRRQSPSGDHGPPEGVS